MTGKLHCCWADHTCPNAAVAAASMVWRNGGTATMYLCEEHLTVVRMKAAVRDIDVITMASDKATRGQ